MTGRPQGALEASKLLRELLGSNADYRRIWQRHAKRSKGSLNQAAIGQVIGNYLWDCGERSDQDTSVPRALKDRVSRALNGSTLSRETLTWFVAAFQMSASDEENLYASLFGYTKNDHGVAHTLRTKRKLALRQKHRTVSLVERYFIDTSGASMRRHTYQTIRAAEDGVDRYFFNHEAGASAIEVVQGGRLGRRHSYGDGLLGVEILLTEPLFKEDTTALEYSAHFPNVSSGPVEVRRPAYARAENIDFAVQFLTGSAPRAAWWCAWDDHFGNRVWEESIEVRNGTIRQYIPYAEETVIGFRWEW
jgi:hypothetical protein